MKFKRKQEIVDAMQVSAALAAHENKSLPGWLKEAFEADEILFGSKSLTCVRDLLFATTIGRSNDWIVSEFNGSMSVVRQGWFTKNYEPYLVKEDLS